jgi:uncharacterized coiled-coil DUF342 family protein
MEDKKSFLQNLSAQLQEWDKDIDKLMSEADKAAAGARAQLLKQIDELRAQRLVAQKKLAELESTSGEAWDEFRAGAEKSWTELKGAFKSAMSKFNKSE